MIKPLLDEVATETEERILEKLEDKICQGISFETNSFNRSLRGLVYDIISKERWRSRQQQKLNQTNWLNKQSREFIKSEGFGVADES